MAARWICGQITGNLQADVRTRKPAKPHKQGVCGLRMGFLQSFPEVIAVMEKDIIFFSSKTFSYKSVYVGKSCKFVRFSKI